MHRFSRLAVAGAVGCVVLGLGTPGVATAQDDPPGAPGAAATWTTGDKDGIGTAVSRDSKVWYTLTGGTLSETYYPAADTPNVRELSFVVGDGALAQRETDAGIERVVQLADTRSLTYRQIAAAPGRWQLTKTYVTDPARSSVVIDVAFTALSGGPYELYALFDASLAGTAAQDTGQTADAGSFGQALVGLDTHLAGTPVASALVASTGFTATSTGYAGTSDGWTDLADNGRMDRMFPHAGPGNIVQTGRLPVVAGNVTLALGFGDTTAAAMTTAAASLSQGFPAVMAGYQAGWHDYLAGLKRAPRQLPEDLRIQYYVSLMTVRAHEDKTFPGAFIASLTLPWGQRVNADGAGGGGGGYHFVWARDLYHQVTSLLAAGDTAAADRAVTWLFSRQQQPDGHFPQNSHVDGSPDQSNVQLDETAFPVLLAWQIGRTDGAFYRDHVKKAADYLVAAGPRTPQERWETEDGYSPSTLASQIAGLTAAADIARLNGDKAGSAIYQGTADSWQRETETWMNTTTGPVGDGRYYIRIEGDGDPNDGDTREYSDGAGVHPERNILDAGFLELVRLGVKAPDDRNVVDSLAETDASLAQDTPSGRMWHRYTRDGYGEKKDGSPWDGTGIGRLWPLLSGERGEYELANGHDAMSYLRTMHNSANDGYMIPEQAWDRSDPTSYGHTFGKGTGSAAPLAWAMAQYVRLAQGIDAGRPVETPRVVAHRYATGRELDVPALTVTSPADLEVATGTTVRLSGTTSGRRLYVGVNGDNQAVQLTGVRGGERRFDVTVSLPDIRNRLVIVAVGPGGGTNTLTRTVLAYGSRIGALTDPAGDDNGPGTYRYPTNPVYQPGTFDLTGLGVYDRGADLAFVTSIAGSITNPFGGDQISHQRVQVYLGSGTGGTAAALPGTNTDTASDWSAVVVTDGRFDTAGVFAPDGTKLADVTLLAIPETSQLVTVVPRAALGVLDPAAAGYGVAMFGNAEAGEGIGFIRPVYDLGYWLNPPPGFSWIQEWRFGGGAGTWIDPPSHDSDLRDPNAIDIIVGAGQSQADVMNWQISSPVALPMVPLDN